MVQWTNLQRIKKSVNPILMQLYITCKNLEACTWQNQVLRQAGRQSGSQADQIWVRFEILKNLLEIRFSAFLNKVLHCNTTTSLFYIDSYYSLLP